MKPWGILGGSFDPIHNGHIQLAREVYTQLDLEKIIFIPAFVAPHKIGQSFAAAPQRLAMTEIAVAGEEGFYVSDMEMCRGAISYTYDSMLALHQQHPGREFYFIIGADSVSQLRTWHRIEELFQLVKFAVVYRPGYEEDIAKAKEHFSQYAERIVAVPTSEYNVSSTQIRRRVQAGLDILDLVPKAVAAYIKENGLYRKD